MKKFFIKSFIFIFIFAVIVCGFISVTDKKLYALKGPTTEQQIRRSFKYVLEEKYDLIALGNSRIYGGINPDKFAVKTFNFAHDNDCFNQQYYKLKYLEKNNNLPENIILGIDYFQFAFLSDTRNHTYVSLLGKNYLKDFDTSFNDRMNQIMTVKQKQFALRIESIKKPLEEGVNVPHLKENGQYIRYGKAKKTDSKDRSPFMLRIQLEYFNKILEFCKDKDINVFMVMPPARQNELKSYTDEVLKIYNDFFQSMTSEDVHYLNYSLSDKFILKDYIDITHLNAEAADRFSQMLNDEIMKVIE